MNNEMKIIILSFISVIFLHSRIIEGLTNDYGKLYPSQKAKVFQLNSFDEAIPGNVYKLNADQLKKELLKYPKAIVYIFTSGCTSSHCKPLITYENYANKYGYKLFLVMNSYMEFDKAVDQDISTPIS